MWSSALFTLLSDSWWIGYSENEKGTWFFATRITKDQAEDHPGFPACRTSVTTEALREMGVLR